MPRPFPSFCSQPPYRGCALCGRSWLFFSFGAKGWVRSPFDCHRPIASQSFRHVAETLATHPYLRSKKQKRSSAKDRGAPTVWKVLPVRTRKRGAPGLIESFPLSPGFGSFLFGHPIFASTGNGPLKCGQCVLMFSSHFHFAS